MRFNLILIVPLAVALASGCVTLNKNTDKQPATLRLHMETSSATGRGTPVKVCRSAPFEVFVEPQPFLNEVHVETASVVTNSDGISIKIEFNRSGALLLEQYTSGNPGRRIAVRTQFGQDPVVDRWLAAPISSGANRTGALMFAPDASADEAVRIARGINVATKELNK